MQGSISEPVPGAKVALVSGCSSGIGRVTAQILLRAGWTVYAGLRNLDDQAALGTAAATPGNTLRPLLLDVTDAAQIAAALAQARTEAGRLDALVNNAGIDGLGALEDQSELALRSVMEVNFFGALALTRAALPLMREQGRGVIVMVSSLSGLLGLPGSSAYCASKFALEGAAESLRNEVGRFGIRVALIEPGGYASAMSSKRGVPAQYPPSSPYRAMIEHLAQADAPIEDPTPVAQLILGVIEAGAPQLRYAAGPQAQQVAARLAKLDDEERQRYARKVTDLDWWHDGSRGPR